MYKFFLDHFEYYNNFLYEFTLKNHLRPER
jgi:hypothetical protein